MCTTLLLAVIATTVFALSAGSLDPTFSGNGYDVLDFGDTGDVARDVVRQSDGKLVVVGSAFNGANDDFALTRYNADGTLDTDFGTLGKTLTDFGSSADIAYGVALQADGKIVVVGSTDLGGDLNFAVARYTTGGLPDNAFSGDGRLVTEVSASVADGAYDVAIDGGGNIVVGGGLYVSDIDDNAVFIRYTSVGDPDNTFGTAGIANIVGSSSSWLRAIAIDGAGKIVGVGRHNNVIRLDTGGTLDTTFDGDGKLALNPTSSDDYGEDILVYPGGKYVIVHQTVTCGVCSQYLSVTRLNNTGTKDNTFSGSDGTADLIINGTHSRLDGYGGIIDAAGRVVVVGTGSLRTDSDYSSVVARFNANGSVDTTFSGDGWATFGTGTGEDRFYAVTLTPDDQIIAVGTTAGNSINQDFAVAAFLAIEILPPSKPALTSPANNTSFTTISLPNPLTFTWGTSSSATSYTLKVKQAGLFGANVISKPGLTTTNYSLSTEERDLLLAGNYGWYVTAIGKGGTTNSDENLFAITIPLPSTPVLVSPTLNQVVTGDASPAFVWNENVGAEQVTNYRLYVRDSKNVVLFNQNFAAGDICISTVCTVDFGTLTTPVNLKNGAYSFKVRATNAAGFKDSSFRAFSIVFPGKPTLVSPIDNTTVNDATPIVTWNQVISAAQYRVTVRNAANKVVVKTIWLDNAAVGCNGTTCAFDITPTGLKNGAHSWTVEARNTAVSPSVSKSAQGKFKVNFPGVPTLQSPTSGEIVTIASPVMTWGAVENATQYELTLVRKAKPTPPALKQKFTTAAVCVDDTCSVDLSTLPLALKKGAHTWQVTAIAPGGYKSKTAKQPFTISLP